MNPTLAGRRILTFLVFLIVIAAVLPAPDKELSDDKHLQEFRQRTDKYTALPSAVDAASVTRLRTDIHRFLEKEAGQKHAEQCLRLLSRLHEIDSTRRKPPMPPKFPFDAATAGRYQKDFADYLNMPLEITNGLGMKFVLVPPGSFMMGSPAEEPGRNAGGYDEPLHAVTLTRPFYLGKHEVTVGQFRRFVESTKHVTDGEKNGGGHAHDEKAVWKHRPGISWRKPGYAGTFALKDEQAVVHVSHADSKAFCAWLQGRFQEAAPKQPPVPPSFNWTYDLPTESQWEWACRAGSATRFWWGEEEDATGKVANVGDRSLKRMHPDWPRAIMAMDDGHAFVAPVGSYRPNAFGLHDMLGNVWEFCSTRYGPYPKGPVTDPTDGDPKRGFAVRGGGWSNVPGDARCASRNADPPHFCHSNLGFRAALVLQH